MFIHIFGICQCYVRRGRIENPCAKTVRNHSFRHKASAWQRSPSRKGLKKKTARHAEADCVNPEERSIRVRVQARQTRKIEIHGGEKRIVSFLENEKENAKMKIPPLSHTFRSAGFINPREIWSKAKEMSTEVDEA